jgi:hypothetical protein
LFTSRKYVGINAAFSSVTEALGGNDAESDKEAKVETTRPVFY